MIVRRATGGDAEAIAILLSKSFLEDTAVVRVSIENNPRYSLSNMYVLEDKNMFPGIIGCLRITPFEVFSRGVKMPMGGIAAVAVQPEARKRGTANALMEDALQRMYEMGYPVSMLFPFRHDFYRKFGYAYVGNVIQYDFSPANLLNFPERLHVRACSKSDRSTLKKILQQEIQLDRSFTPIRNDNFWDLIVFPKFKDAYIYDDGETKGYIVFDLNKESTGNSGVFGQSVMSIKEFVALDAAANKGLWAFVGSLADQINHVKFLAPPDYPFHLYMKEPRELAFRRLFFEYKTFSTVASGFMLRVVDVQRALSKLRHTLDVRTDFALRIDDGNLPQNTKTLNLHLHSGETIVEETKSPAKFQADIGVFSQIYSGFLKPSDAVRYGFAEAEPSIIGVLDELFRAPSPFVYQFDIF